MRRTFCALLIGALVALAAPQLAHGQIGTTTDILVGRVTGPDGKPIEHAEIVATSAETGISRKKQTGSNGQYTILFPDGGGQYRIEFRAIGFPPIRRNVARQSDEDRLVTDVQFGSSLAPQLSRVQVMARQGPRGGRGERPTPGEAGRGLTTDQLSRLPVDASDLSAIAALAPGVVPIEGTDSTAASFSVAGQRSTLNNVTLDGLTFGNFSVPQEGVRNTRVVTNTYDPSRGQFTGGIVASTTRGGTNELTGGISYSRRDPTLQFEGDDTSAFTPQYLQDQISVGLGGPIVKDKAFVFGSMQFRRRSDPFQSLLSASPATLTALGAQPDSVARFINTVNGYGIPVTAGVVPERRIGDNTSGLLRFDYLLTDAHTLTLRFDYHHNTQDPTRNSSFAFPNNSGTSTTTGGGVALTVSSVFENGLINELRTYVSRDKNELDPFIVLPAGRVRVTSALSDGTQGITVLSFGGNASFPQASTNSLVEVSDELSYLSKNRAHRVRLGTLWDFAQFKQDLTQNQVGTFTYNSLDDFIANTPAAFTRSVTPFLRNGRSVDGAVYLGDTWRPTNGAQIVYGLRAEGTRYGGVPPLNTDIQQLFGMNTNDFPSEIHVSPRVGFSMNLTKPDPNDPFTQFRPAFILRGGIGEFRAKTPTGLFTSALGATGLANTEQQLSCIGSAVPTPDWPSYVGDPSSVPDQCVGGVVVPPVFSSLQPSVTAFDPDFKAPRAWRGSLGVQHRLFGFVTASVDATYAYGLSLYGVTDLNLNTTPAFTVSNEGDRPVYVTPSAIVPATGLVSAAASRRYDQYGEVLELNSNLHSDTRQVTFAIAGGTSSGTLLNLSYTLARTRDQSSFTCCSAAQGFASPTTAGNPNIAEWAPSDLDTRHSIQATITKPVFSFLDLSAIGRFASGRPFTPMVGGDINGDGVRNDRAFIFNPATATDPNVASAMQQLLNTAPARVRDCLETQMGEVAGRNSCRNAWTPSFDLQANFRPSSLGLSQRLTVSLVTSNLLAGLDQLLHGDNLRGWGEPDRADPTLLYVRGFDPATNTYVYDVNGRFGSNNARNAFRVPFVIGVQGRFTIGPDARARFRSIFGARVNNIANGSALNGERTLNPIAQILAMRDTLHLTAAQFDQLSVISDTLAAQTRVLADSIRAHMDTSGKRNVAPQEMFAKMRPFIIQGRKNMGAALEAAKGVLTPEQWAKVPEDVKVPRMGGRRADF